MQLNLDILKQTLKPIGATVEKNLPQILLATGLVSFGSAIVAGVKCGGKVTDIHEDESWRRHKMRSMNADKKDIRESYFREAKELAPVLLPTVTLTVTGAVCVIASSRIQARRSAALLAAYSLAERTIETYQEKLAERLDDVQQRELLQDISDEMAKKDDYEGHEIAPFDETLMYRPAEDGTVLFKDCLSGRFFRSTMNEIRRAESEINKELSSEARPWVKHRKFMDELGLECDSIVSEGFGWEVGRCPLDIFMTTVHPGTPVEYVYLHYKYVLIDNKVFQG